MTSSGTVPLKKIWKMLDKCLPGHIRKERVHHWRIEADGLTYPTFPKGRHGARQNPRIEIGHVRRLARYFDIEDCARKALKY